MSNIGNKETMAKNLKYYIAKSGKDRRELAEIWGFPYSTITEWINGEKYPRIDRIETMANYFGILKSDLIEEKTEEHREMQKNNDTLADIVIRLRTDEAFFSLVETLYDKDSESSKSRSSVLCNAVFKKVGNDGVEGLCLSFLAFFLLFTICVLICVYIWYRCPLYGKSISPLGDIHFPSTGNAFPLFGQCVPSCAVIGGFIVVAGDNDPFIAQLFQ